jgi:hypothetical protein
MKAIALQRRFSLSLFAFVGLLAASRSMPAATLKADARAPELVTALQAVSPDPLGGRLGPAAVAVSSAMPAKSPSAPETAARNAGDQRAYLAWKSAQKS